MKIILVFILLLLSCESIPQNENTVESEKIQETPDYIIDEQGNMLFKDWETAYKYASNDVNICITLMQSCIKYAQYIYDQYTYGNISEKEFNEQFDEIEEAYNTLYYIYMLYFYHEELEGI